MRFLVLYRAPQATRAQVAGLDPAQLNAIMEAWMTWAGRAGKALLDMGAPLGDAAVLGAPGDPGGRGQLGGYSLVEAESLEAAKALFDGHPHLAMPGASIEILEQLPRPGG